MTTTITEPLPFRQDVSMGCDPEFFFTVKDSVIGAEKVIGDIKNSYFVVDGVQAELHPSPSYCRALLGTSIMYSFATLKRQLDDSIKIDFSTVVSVDKKELESLSEQARKFGCAPSYNAYTETTSKITVNPATYTYRSAGGHIHLGPYPTGIDKKKWRPFIDHAITIKVLDTIVGNTCVLIDRDPWAVERRKVYGKAGEYRLPAWGIEYRTLSNFWLRAYELMSLVFGLARFSIRLVSEKRENEILSLIDLKEVEKAINTNNFELAMKNFQKIENVLYDMMINSYGNYPFSKARKEDFYFFLEKGIDYWFPNDFLRNWLSLNDGHGKGWENFLNTKVSREKQTVLSKPKKSLGRGNNDRRYKER